MLLKNSSLMEMAIQRGPEMSTLRSAIAYSASDPRLA